MKTSAVWKGAGCELRMLPERGIHWAQQDMLLVADPHFGKEATFRRHGIPVPRGSTDQTLSRMTRMLSATSARRLVILGDMFHARSSLSADVVLSLDQFFTLHCDLDVTLIRGNHDARLGKLPPHWPVRITDDLRIDRVALGHHPKPVASDLDLLICGHIHPAVRPGGPGDDVGRLPCYWLSQKRLVLPAIGHFTGTHLVRRGVEDRIWMIVQDRVLEYRRTVSSESR